MRQPVRRTLIQNHRSGLAVVSDKDAFFSAQVRRSPTAASPKDIALLYQLLLDYEVRSEAEIAWATEVPLLQAVATLLASVEFQRAVVDKVVAGDGVSGGEKASMALIRFARNHLGVDASAYTTRAELLAKVVESDLVESALARSNLSISWSPVALAEFLRDPVERTEPQDPLYSATLERLEFASKGVELLYIQNLALDGVRNFRMTSNDPAITFKLDAAVMAGAEAVELTFCTVGLRKRATGLLYVDFGQGLSEQVQVQLTPRGRRQYSALLCAPDRIRRLRWDPDNVEGEIIIGSIVARPVYRTEFEQKLATALIDPSDALSDGEPTSAALIKASQRLTEVLYDHSEIGGGDYASWILENEPSPHQAKAVWAAELDALSERPLISILVPTYETPALLLREMIESVMAQVYDNWELCIADDASKSPHVRQIIEGYMAEEPRIKAVFRDQNGHISEASNSALKLVTGDWLALLDHDDLLTPDALLAVASEINAHPDAQFIYSDEDKLSADNKRYEPFFKPDYSPELLRSQNYLNHLSVHRTKNVRAVKGWRKGFEGSQDYDLNLRTLEKLPGAKVRHIPRILYHWRAVEGSTALSNSEKSYAFIAGQKALEEHVKRMKWAADVEAVPNYPFYRVRYKLPEPQPLVSVVIPTRDRADLLAVCLNSLLERTRYQHYEILIVDNGSEEAATFALFNKLTRDSRVQVIQHPGPFNYSKINNRAVEQSRGEIVCLLNNDIEVISSGWMDEMAAWALLPRVGCVGAKLYYPNDTIQHAGVTLGLGGVAGHPHKHRGRNDPGYFGRLAVSHDVSAVTGACLMIRREIYDAVGGLDERLQVAFNDVDFCIRVREAGYANVFTPFAELYHHESVSRGEDEAPEKRARFVSEVNFMHERWADKLTLDPFYSPNLSHTRDDYSIRAD